MTGIDFNGPHYDPDLIGPNGKLQRLHKGGGSPPKAAPQARQPLEEAGEEAREERKKARNRTGYSKSILADFAGDEDKKKTVLG